MHHVKRIAELAEVDLDLARVCIQHLLFYSAIVLVDLFQFSNSYAALPGIADIAQYEEEEGEGVTDLKAECEAYLYSGSGWFFSLDPFLLRSALTPRPPPF